MAQLKEKSLEELKKMASKKKIEGRSKMNKAQLVRALSKCISKKMIGGAILSKDDIDNMILHPEQYIINMYSSMDNGTNGQLWDLRSIKKVRRLVGKRYIYILDTRGQKHSFESTSNVTLNYDIQHKKFILHINSDLVKPYESEKHGNILSNSVNYDLVNQ